MISNKDKAASISDMVVWNVFGYDHDLGTDVKLTDFYTQSGFSIQLMQSIVDSGYTRYFADLSSRGDSSLSIYENSANGVVMQVRPDSSIRVISVDDVKWSADVPPASDTDVHIIMHDDDGRLIKIFAGTDNERIVTSGTCVCFAYKANYLSPYSVSVDSWGEIPDEGSSEEYVGTHDVSVRYVASSKKEIAYAYDLTGDVSVASGDPSIGCDMILMLPGQRITFTKSGGLPSVYNAMTVRDTSVETTATAKAGICAEALNHRIVYIDRHDARPYILPVIHVNDKNYDSSTSMAYIYPSSLDYDSLYHNTGMIKDHKDGIYAEGYQPASGQYGIDGVLEYRSGVNACDGIVAPTRRSPEMRILSTKSTTYCRVRVNVSLSPKTTTLFKTFAFETAHLVLDIKSKSGSSQVWPSLSGDVSFPASSKLYRQSFTYDFIYDIDKNSLLQQASVIIVGVKASIAEVTQGIGIGYFNGSGQVDIVQGQETYDVNITINVSSI